MSLLSEAAAQSLMEIDGKAHSLGRGRHRLNSLHTLVHARPPLHASNDGLVLLLVLRRCRQAVRAVQSVPCATGEKIGTQHKMEQDAGWGSSFPSPRKA